jgi:protein SCO1
VTPSVAMLLFLTTVTTPGQPILAAGERPPVIKEIGFDQRLGESVPLDAEFRDEEGRTVRLGDYFGRKPVVLNLVYFDCPMLCTVSLNGLTTALDVASVTPGQEFELVTISFDSRETPGLASAKKKAYLARYKRAGAAAGWHFLTGEQASIDRVTRAVGFRYAWDGETRQFAHPAGLLVLTPQGTIARYLFGIEYSPKDLRLALVESGEGKVGGPVDDFLLFCYQYNPLTGRYSASILNLVRALAILTVLGLGGFVYAMWRRERTVARGLGYRAVEE